MNNKKFFKSQNDSTAVKIEIYKQYIESYLYKVLCFYGNCFVGDLFCGPGKNGLEKGSPLSLIDIINKTLESSIIDARTKNIYVLFNDIDKDNIKKLKEELSKIGINKKIKIAYGTDDSSKIIDNEKIVNILKRRDCSKFFFLDPYNYSSVDPIEIKKIIDSSSGEVLLFLPIFDAYRFSNTLKIKPVPKLKKFLDDFTRKGVFNYVDIYDFANSISEKMEELFPKVFAKIIIIDSGSRKHSLLFLTKNIKGMFLINRVFLNKSYDGKGVCVSEVIKQSQRLFKKEAIETDEFKKCVKEFENNLLEEIKKKKIINNVEIIDFTARKGFLCKHANDFLKKMKKENKIKVRYDEGLAQRNFYVNENYYNNIFCFIEII
jgi:three-Cys-motif partner protein